MIFHIDKKICVEILINVLKNFNKIYKSATKSDS